MKKALVLLGSLALAASATAADPGRLALWITASVGTSSGSECVLDANQAASGSLPNQPPTLTERDVTAWDPVTGRWTLDPARFAGGESGSRLQDHCFLLAIDGKPASSGIALSEYSARLTGFPTLVVIERNGTLILELMSSNHGSQMRHLHIEALGGILKEKTTSNRR